MRRLKRALSVLLCILLLLSTASIAYAQPAVVATGDCSAEGSNVTWTYYADKTMVISGTGAMSDTLRYWDLWEEYRIEKLVVESGITHIGEDSFREDLKNGTPGWGGLQEVSFPNTLISIGYGAFYGCFNLETVTIPDSVVEIKERTFMDCLSLSTVVFSNSVKAVSDSLFYNCRNLTSITNMDAVEEIYGEAFAYCEKLCNISLPDHGIIIFSVNAFLETALVNNSDNYVNGVLYVGNHIIATDPYSVPAYYEVKDGTKTIAPEAFPSMGSSFDARRTVVLPDSVECIGNSAFGYRNISSLPASSKYIGPYAFYNCRFLTEIVIPSTAKMIEHDAFGVCALSSVTISEGVEYIGAGAFLGNLFSTVYIPSSVEYVGYRAFGGINLKSYNVSLNNNHYKSINGVLFSKDGTRLVGYPMGGNAQEYEIPDGTSVIEMYAFASGSKSTDGMSLKTVKIPSTVTLIKDKAFYACWAYKDIADGSVMQGIENVIFETGERTLLIGSGAFAYCYQLKNIELPQERVYCLFATAFVGTAFANNPENWDDGALYLGDILIGFDDYHYSLPEEYVVKADTKVIADFANRYNYRDNDLDDIPNDYLTEIVDVPDSVVIIGSGNNITDVDLPTSLMRCGSDGVRMDEDVYDEFEKIYANGIDVDVPDFLDLLYYNYAYCGWLLNIMPVGMYYGITDELLVIDDGVVGLEDGTGFVNLQLGLYTKGVILPQSLKHYGLFINANDRAVFEDYYYLTGELYNGAGSVTFLNKQTDIYDSPLTLGELTTICGYTGSTAEAYAQKYNRKFVAIDNCAHELTCVRGAYAATCTRQGSTGDIYCQYCGTFLEKGTKTEKVDHEYGEWTQLSPATCTDAAVEVRKCTGCETEQTRKGAGALGHDFVVKSVQQPTCTQDGYCEYVCDRCGETYTDYENFKAIGHFDNNDDGYCDECGQLLDATKSCGCMCHKDGILGFFYKIIGFFWKIFKINPVCQCGVAHY